VAQAPVHRWSRRADRFENAFGLVLLLVFITFVLTSLVPYHGVGGVFIATFGALTATVALGTARARRRLIVWAARTAVVAVLLAIVGALSGERAWLGVSAFLEGILLCAAALVVLRAVVTEERVGFRTILGAVSVYITLGLLFAFIYAGVDRVQGEPFFGEASHVHAGDTVFFSMTTLTTTGYGDIVPGAQPGKLLANVEMLVGQIFLVTLIARLVSMWRPGQWLREGAGVASRHDHDEVK
jgi:Ion channel